MGLCQDLVNDLLIPCEHDTSCVEILAFNKFVVNLEGKVVQDILQNYFKLWEVE